MNRLESCRLSSSVSGLKCSRQNSFGYTEYFDSSDSDDIFSEDDNDYSDSTADESDHCTYRLDSEDVLIDKLERDFSVLRRASTSSLIAQQFFDRSSQAGSGSHALDNRWCLPVLLRPATPSSKRMCIKFIPKRITPGKPNMLTCHRLDLPRANAQHPVVKRRDASETSDFSLPRLPEPSSEDSQSKCILSAKELKSDTANSTSGSDNKKKSHSSKFRALVRRSAELRNASVQEKRNASAQEQQNIVDRNRLQQGKRIRSEHMEVEKNRLPSSADGDSGSSNDSRQNYDKKHEFTLPDATASRKRKRATHNSIGATNSSVKESDEQSGHRIAETTPDAKIAEGDQAFLNFYRGIYKYEVEPEMELLFQKKILECAHKKRTEPKIFRDESFDSDSDEGIDSKIDLVKGTWETLRMVHEVGHEGMFNEAYGSYNEVINMFMDSASVYLGLENEKSNTDPEDQLHTRFLTSELVLPMMRKDMLLGLRRTEAFTNQTSSKQTKTEQTLTNGYGTSNYNSGNGNVMSSNGHSSNGNGHASNLQGNGDTSNGNGKSDNSNPNGNGDNGHNSSNGDGNGSNENGVSSGNIISSNGNGSNGNGNSSNCIVNSSNGHFNSSNGRGNSSNNDCHSGGMSKTANIEEFFDRHAIEDRIGEISDNALCGSDSDWRNEVDDDLRSCSELYVFGP